MILAVARRNRQIVDAGNTQPHQSLVVEFPILVTVGTIVLAAIVMPLVRKPHSDAITGKRPRFLDESVVELASPLAREKRDDLAASLEKLRAVAPTTIFRVC